MVPVITYKDIFPGEIPSLEQLLSDIPSELIVSIVCAINAELHLTINNIEMGLLE